MTDKLTRRERADQKISAFQQRTYRFVEKRFTFNKALILTMLVSSSFAFVGRDCYGALAYDSPLVESVLFMASLSALLVVLFVKLTSFKLLRAGIVSFCSYYLTYETFGIFSTAIMDYEKACKPFLYAHDGTGYVMAFIPAVIFMVVCFFDYESSFEGNKNEI